MKAGLAFVVLVCVVSSPFICKAQGTDFQTGKIVTVEKLPGGTSTGSGTDAPIASDTNRYNLSIQLGDTVYICRVKVSGAIDLDWVQGKDIQAKVDGKVMRVKKANGKVVKLSITGSKKSE
jgi:hypothetical protein